MENDDDLFEFLADERKQWEYFFGMISRENEAQETYYLVLSAVALIGGGGFEKIFEQVPSFGQYAEAFVRIGMPEVKPIFERADSLVPADLRIPENNAAMWDVIRSLFERFKELSYEFYGATGEVHSVIAEYILAHRETFANFPTSDSRESR